MSRTYTIISYYWVAVVIISAILGISYFYGVQKSHDIYRNQLADDTKKIRDDFKRDYQTKEEIYRTDPAYIPGELGDKKIQRLRIKDQTLELDQKTALENYLNKRFDKLVEKVKQQQKGLYASNINDMYSMLNDVRDTIQDSLQKIIEGEQKEKIKLLAVLEKEQEENEELQISMRQISNELSQLNKEHISNNKSNNETIKILEMSLQDVRSKKDQSLIIANECMNNYLKLLKGDNIFGDTVSWVGNILTFKVSNKKKVREEKARIEKWLKNIER